MKTVAVHSGGFHADDVFAIATLRLAYDDSLSIVRTRDEEVIKHADIVVDVGGVYDPERQRYDHHQTGAPVRENGIPYAAFGLVWKHYGETVCGSANVAAAIEEQLCQQIDATDNGIQVCEKNEYQIVQIDFDSFVKQWQAERDSEETMDTQFTRIVTIVQEYLRRCICTETRKLKDVQLAHELYEQASDKKVIVSDRALSRKFFIDTETQVLVMPDDAESGNWLAVMIPVNEDSFKTKAQFPENWAGKRDEELVAVSHIEDAVFCHKNRYLFVARSKAGVLMAAKSLD